MRGTIETGLIVGGILGGVTTACLAWKRSGVTSSGEEDELASYPSVYRNPTLRALLQDATPVFKALDSTTFHCMLHSLNDLCKIYESCRSGDARPVLVAQALERRRQASTCLSSLSKKARQQKPMAASDLSEDLLGLNKFLEDQLYNITQEQSLQSSYRT